MHQRDLLKELDRLAQQTLWRCGCLTNTARMAQAAAAEIRRLQALVDEKAGGEA